MAVAGVAVMFSAICDYSYFARMALIVAMTDAAFASSAAREEKQHAGSVCVCATCEQVLILKWGGVLTHAGRQQAEELGKVFRMVMYPRCEQHLCFVRLRFVHLYCVQQFCVQHSSSVSHRHRWNTDAFFSVS